MPTARELLEQADALMRRNRSAMSDDIPVLTEAVSPRPTFRVPLRPSPESPPPVVEEAPEAIPTLTEKAPAAERSADSIAAEGEPSDWLDFDEGEPSITGQAPDSIIQVPKVPAEDARDDTADEEAPPHAEAIELMPAAEAGFDEEFSGAVEAEAAVEAARAPLDQAPEPAPAPVPVDEAQEHERSAAFVEEAPPPMPEVVQPSVVAPAAPEEPTPLAARLESFPHEMLPPEVAPLPMAAETEIVFESPTSADWNVEAALSAPETEAPPQAIEVSMAAATAVEERGDEAFPSADAIDVVAPPEPPAPEPVSLAPSPAEALGVAPAPAAPAAVPDDARWDAIAEEIRMQVLQRIDLFTDTGLREQLGRRLQPIVDRASADLVATINQHVGELLRAYVAEAIEREIDSWRKNH
jgi:hypothetical protein